MRFSAAQVDVPHPNFLLKVSPISWPIIAQIDLRTKWPLEVFEVCGCHRYVSALATHWITVQDSKFIGRKVTDWGTRRPIKPNLMPIVTPGRFARVTILHYSTFKRL